MTGRTKPNGIKLHDTSPGQAIFLGSLIGFLALLGGALGGALFNAWLNRRRDGRLRREEQRAVATALRAELAGCTKILLSDAELLNYSTSMPNFTIADLAHAIRIMPHVIPKLGLLDQETIEKASPGKDLKPAAV